MDRDVNKTKKLMRNNKGFTLVEVIAVLVILGILAAVAIPKFFDMQDEARMKAIEGAIGELNGQLALSFAQNALKGGPTGGYEGLPPDTAGYLTLLGPDFQITGVSVVAAGTLGEGGPGSDGLIELTSDVPGTHVWAMTWTAGAAGGDGPGYFQRGAKQ